MDDDAAEPPLPQLTLRRFCQEDHAGAGAPDGFPRLMEGLQLGYEPPALRHKRHRRAFPAGDHQAGDAFQLLLCPHLHHLYSSHPAEQRHVLPKGALQRKHADAHLLLPLW